MRSLMESLVILVTEEMWMPDFVARNEVDDSTSLHGSFEGEIIVDEFGIVVHRHGHTLTHEFADREEKYLAHALVELTVRRYRDEVAAI